MALVNRGCCCFPPSSSVADPAIPLATRVLCRVAQLWWRGLVYPRHAALHHAASSYWLFTKILKRLFDWFQFSFRALILYSLKGGLKLYTPKKEKKNRQKKIAKRPHSGPG